MIPALLAMLGPKLLAGLGGGAASGALSGGLLGMSNLMGTAGGQALQELAPTLSASMKQTGPQVASPTGGLLNFQSGGQAPQMESSPLPGYGQAINLGGKYQRKFKGLLS